MKEEELAVVVRGRGEKIWQIGINRAERKNAVNGPTARALHEAFLAFEADAVSCVAILHGNDDIFCAGADLMEMNNPLEKDMRALGPMGVTRLQLRKPVIGAIEGYCVAGGLELALWCDMRIASSSATFGVFCRRWGVPLIDGGTVRLPRIIGQGRAMDLILTGREVGAAEALQIGLVNRVVAPNKALHAAMELAQELCRLPQVCMRNDRASLLAQWSLSEMDALDYEFKLGLDSLQHANEGVNKFKQGQGRGGSKL